MATEVKLPEVGEGIDSGTVVGILVSVGDSVEVDQPLLELETDKAVVEVPSSAAGTVKEIHVKENEEAKIGQVIVILDEAGKAAEAEPEKEEEPEQEAKQAEAEPEKEIASKQEAEPKKETSASQSTSQDTARKSDRFQIPVKVTGSTIPAAPSVRR